MQWCSNGYCRKVNPERNPRGQLLRGDLFELLNLSIHTSEFGRVGRKLEKETHIFQIPSH